MKKFLKITGITLVVIIAVLFAIPFLFKGKILRIVKSEINKNINARVDFDDISISLLRRFPKVSVSIEKIQVTGNGRFSSDTLIAAGSIDAALNLMSIIKGDKMIIYSVAVNQPRIHAIVARDGAVNWDITKPDTTGTTSDTSAPFSMQLKKYAINDGYISFVDSAAGMHAEITGLQHEGNGDFTADNFTLSTKTNADAVNFTMASIPYLVNTNTKINADIQVENKISKYTFKTVEIALNELKIATDGFFQLVNDSTYNMDIRFNAPSTDFKNILSLIPVVYQKDFAKVKTSGKAILNGAVKGTMGAKSLPAYNINLDVANGFFQYPDLPSPVQNINIAVKVDNPDGVTDHTVVDIPKGHIEMENEPFDFRLLMKNPVSDMWVDAAAKGKLDLSKVSGMVKLDKGTSMKGLLNADVSVKGFVDAVQKQQFDKFSAAGTIALNDFKYVSNDYPDGVSLSKLLMTFNPKNVTLNEAAGSYLNSNFEANGYVNNLIAYALKDRPLSGVLNVKADKLNVNDWMGPADSTKAETASTPFIVPANLDLTMNALVSQVKYDNLLMEHVSGSLLLADEAIKMNNVKGNALDGSIIVNGSYSTRENKKTPAITLNYDVHDLDVQKTFNTFNTVQKLMPVGKFLSGKLNSKLGITGLLGQNMLPDLTTLTGEGNLFLIEGLLEKFKPLEKLAERLNVDELKNISLREVREQFEFNAGKVFVKPFKIKVKDIEMEIGGMHGFDQSIDYAIHLKIPRALIGTKGNQLVNDLAAKISSKGVPVKLGETVNLNVKMLGTLTNPDIRFDLKEGATSIADDIKEQAKDFAQARIDSSKKAIKDTVESVKRELVKQAGDKLKEQLFRKKDTTASDSVKTRPVKPEDKLKESGKGLIENINPFKKKK
ncbi:MAG TPA: AsmA-like C-terminal region-containing protein [Flavitalea sp.]|nr:AsmA-like C-terminal region-containing protein [Flavitalea sp.]